mgnify:CR=1 FL=1
MQDVFPDEARRWAAAEAAARAVGVLYGYGEIRTPLVEATSLFVRGIGEGTDIVDKEMFSFTDAGGKGLTLRPEGTAGVVRAYLEHHVYKTVPLARYFYLGPMFRRERPQAGRRRQFHQFGVEALGSDEAALDVEIVDLLMFFLGAAGVRAPRLEINSVGCADCRPIYREKLQAFLRDRSADLCADCRARAERNPLRVMDCKNPCCRPVLEAAPVVSDHLCPGCRDHFQAVLSGLENLGIAAVRRPSLVRGLDYYTRTVFEVYSDSLGAQDAVAAGGRYDDLVRDLGGPPTPAAGFSVGLERLLLCAGDVTIQPPRSGKKSVYCVCIGEEAAAWGARTVSGLRRAGIPALMDYGNRSTRAQFREANRAGVDFVVTRGEAEAGRGKVKFKDMGEGVEREVADSLDVLAETIKKGEG